MTTNIKISAIICTHNRPSYLKKAVQSLVGQTLPKHEYEVIVVDNASTDDTKAVFEGFLHVQNLRYIYEPILGLSQARNTGWQNAKGSYTAYIDDDAIACPEWLERIVHAFDTVKPAPGSVGGKVAPIWEAPRPEWLPKELETALTIIDWSDEPRFLSDEKEFLVGANVAYPRKILEETGGFSTNLGRKGKNLLSNDEILLKRYLRRQNLGSYYDPGICVQHHVVPERLQKSWFYRRYLWQGISDEIMTSLEASGTGRSLTHLRSAVSSTLVLLRCPSNIWTWVIPADTPETILSKCKLHVQLGRIYAQIQIGLGFLR